MKSETRLLAEAIQKKSGESLVAINYQAHELVSMGLESTTLEALKYLLSLHL